MEEAVEGDRALVDEWGEAVDATHGAIADLDPKMSGIASARKTVGKQILSLKAKLQHLSDEERASVKSLSLSL